MKSISVPDKNVGIAGHLYYDPYFPRLVNHMKELIAANRPLLIRVYPGKDYPMTDEELHGIVDREGHVVSVIGYDDETEEFLVCDPWNSAKWGGGRSGLIRIPYMQMPNELVNCTKGAVMIPDPWEVDIKVPRDVIDGDIFNVSCTVKYPQTAPISDSYNHVHGAQCQIILPEGLMLVDGKDIQRLEDGYFKPGDLKELSWKVKALKASFGEIKVKARGIITGVDPYPYTDVIGAQGIIEIKVKSGTLV
ncbi:C39 family peptidase [Alkalihalobacillus clausii]|uniref:C39 family peptidase n=1 Tax=Shouchella clausii TaxID=79880 RepID=UPI00203BCDE7|nr:C39 family peptidase [Shouchella clausii]MCM3547724.1 C39 family peptidase [Shouchella clausii]